MAHETEVNKALQSLKNQGIPVSNPVVIDDGHVFDVMGFMLTTHQIVTLYRENKLNKSGIREFAKDFKAKNESSQSFGE